ncbi:MAG: 16S rRNA (adenine(1518)-N(6)/adenine(1519)-N(6))-dimethyltransferase RsmA [Chloroflexota bacterium]|nr:MAG: 16S rRNA (adenine(1518)-N(6)/adenine(1519)-N(6))-dimethyltransferase RsmA [Chloroflexota bacterium]
MDERNPFLNETRIRAALRALGLRPSRQMGQNFLIDGDALQTIVAAAELRPDDVVVEVGPGLGVLTWELVRSAGAVVAVELDKRLAERLRQELAAPNLSVVQGDILRLPPEELLAPGEPGDGPRPYKVVANLPYAITSPVLRHFLEARRKPELMTVLVQWEVAERIAAGPGDLSVLAHAVQIYAEPEVVARVPSQSFIPQPAVDSAVLRLRVRERPPVAVDDPEALMRGIKAGFLHARKQLGNALPSGLAAMGLPADKARVLEALAAAGVEPSRRAETVRLEEWAAVYNALR